MIFIRHPFGREYKYLDFETASVDGNILRNKIESYFGYTDFTLLYNGKKLHDAEIVSDNSTVHVTFSLPGGKGGFGSMLRAIGAQIEKTTNREACRDLSGRRLRDINEEERLKKWISKKAEREAEKKKRRQARIERLKSKPVHKFFDYEYEKEITALPERINDALSEGLQKAKQPVKQPCEKPGPSEPRKRRWLSEEFSTSSDSDSEINTIEDGSPSKKSKIVSRDSSSYDSSSEISDLSQPGPSSSKVYSHIDFEENSTNNVECVVTEVSSESGQLKDNSNDSVKVDIPCEGTENICGYEEDKLNCIENGGAQSSKNEVVINESETNSNTATKEPEVQDNLPIDLFNFQSSSELEELGLDKLKAELMSRGLKCGGTLSDRAQRLWKVRGLESDKYPTNLLVKSKK